MSRQTSGWSPDQAIIAVRRWWWPSVAAGPGKPARALGMMLAACVVGSAAPVAARQPATSPASDASAADAAVLARLLYPEALSRTIVTYTIRHVVGPSYHAEANLQALEADHPGIIDAMVAAMHPELERGRREALPRLWARTGAVYAAGLTRDELQLAVAFAASPVGRRLALADQDAVAHADPARDGTGVSAEPAAGVVPGDIEARRIFAASATGRKLAALQPRIEAIIDAWNEAPTPETYARMSAAMSTAAARFVTGTATPTRASPSTP